MVALVRAALDRVRTQPGIQLQLKLNAAGRENVEGMHCVPWRTSYICEFPPLPPGSSGGECAPPPIQGLRFGNSRNHLRVMCSVNKAIALGVQARIGETPGDLRAWYRLYLDTMRDKAVPARPYRFFESLWRELQTLGLMRLWVAEFGCGSSRRIIAGLIVLTYGETAFYAFAAGSRTDFGLHPNDVLQFHAMHDAWRAGCRKYDLGEVPEGNQQLAHYKKKWGSTPVRLYRYYYPAPAGPISEYQQPGLAFRVGEALWRRIPLGATAAMGDWIYRYL
jgi:hypothetical protein